MCLYSTLKERRSSKETVGHKEYAMNDEGFTYTVSGMLKEYKGSNPSVTIPEGVAEIGGRAFRGKPITSVHLPKAMKAIGSEAFYGCRSLSSINIPDSVT